MPIDVWPGTASGFCDFASYGGASGNMLEVFVEMAEAMAGQTFSSIFLARSGSDDPLNAISGMPIINASITSARKAMVADDCEDCMSYRTSLFEHSYPCLNDSKEQRIIPLLTAF